MHSSAGRNCSSRGEGREADGGVSRAKIMQASHSSKTTGREGTRGEAVSEAAKHERLALPQLYIPMHQSRSRHRALVRHTSHNVKGYRIYNINVHVCYKDQVRAFIEVKGRLPRGGTSVADRARDEGSWHSGNRPPYQTGA